MLNHAITTTIDAKGLACPMPLLKAKQALNKLSEGDVLEVWATDAGSFRDFQVFLDQSAHELLLAEETDGIFRYLMRRGPLAR
ncbi:Sulfur carrier protein TusA [BD1-7 clade bacterium]|uniref:Sulfur carrier protein TusA n=1 Tax=BD1-7 clade bacterium TaxID=2029982 RepID=A0A5S9N6T7_9GAMM|nr:Sulfur carrier protein TusA [BD1-7 clade bacterium]CAA0085018.1 Sulfur carrier protein TusA [BD1-7 clade bacterium]